MKTLHKKYPNKSKNKHKKTKKKNYKKGGSATRNSTPYVPTMQENIDEFINSVERNITPGTTHSSRHQFGTLITDLETIQPLDNFTPDDVKKIYSAAEMRYDYISLEIQAIINRSNTLINRRDNLGELLPRLNNLINNLETNGQMSQNNSLPPLQNPQFP